MFEPLHLVALFVYTQHRTFAWTLKMNMCILNIIALGVLVSSLYTNSWDKAHLTLRRCVLLELTFYSISLTKERSDTICGSGQKTERTTRVPVLQLRCFQPFVNVCWLIMWGIKSKKKKKVSNSIFFSFLSYGKWGHRVWKLACRLSFSQLPADR